MSSASSASARVEKTSYFRETAKFVGTTAAWAGLYALAGARYSVTHPATAAIYCTTGALAEEATNAICDYMGVPEADFESLVENPQNTLRAFVARRVPVPFLGLSASWAVCKAAGLPLITFEAATTKLPLAVIRAAVVVGLVAILIISPYLLYGASQKAPLLHHDPSYSLDIADFSCRFALTLLEVTNSLGITEYDVKRIRGTMRDGKGDI